jgi:hypothetical protein
MAGTRKLQFDNIQKISSKVLLPFKFVPGQGPLPSGEEAKDDEYFFQWFELSFW